MARNTTPHDAIMDTLFNGAQQPPADSLDWDDVRAEAEAEVMAKFGDNCPILALGDSDEAFARLIADYHAR